VSIRLRVATPDDIDAIHPIYAHHVLHGLASFEEVPPDAAELARRQADVLGRGFPYVVAVDGDGRILGYAYAGPYRTRSAYRHTVEDSIYLAPDQGRRGIGRLLLERLIADCTAMGARQMIAVIGDLGNHGSIGLHRACGFHMVGTLPAVGLKFGRWVDSVLMQRALGAGETTLPG
jgi:L-amino acid N-acyltransferase YncA